MNFIASFFCIIFVVFHATLMVGLYLESRRNLGAMSSFPQITVPVSIIIPVHNEADRIKPLLETLLYQDYPVIEVLFIDDRSSDSTVSLLSDFSAQFNRNSHTCRIITLTENPGPNYKQFALSRGFSEVSGDMVLLTDADCELPPTWVSGMVKRMSAVDTGIMVGPVFKVIPRPSLLYKTQAFDHALRYMYSAASIGLNSAGGGFGNNMIVRKAALESAGGYAAVPVSVTEDAAMISFVKNNTSLSVRAGLGADIQVMTETEQDWARFIIQTLRWTKGGIFSPDLGTKIPFNALMGMISIGVGIIPFLVWVPSLWLLPVGVYCGMLMNTLAVLQIAKGSLKDFTPLDYVAQFLFAPVFNTFLTVMAIFRFPVYWKGKKV